MRLSEDIMSVFLLIFGIAFLMFVVWFVVHDSDKQYQRRLNEAREFGFGGEGKHNIFTLEQGAKKKIK